MTANSTSHLRSFHLRSFAKGALLVSAAFPLSALIVAERASAEQTVEVNAAEAAASVQAKIDAAKATPDRDISITVTSKGTVTGPGTIGISPIAGQGDGAIVFGNAGSIGAVDKAGAVTDSVGVVLNGSPAKADNTLTATNSGLVTGGFSATGFGGTVSLDNSGTIHNGVNLAGKSDVKIASTGAVRSGNVVVAAVETTKSTVSGDTTTDVTASGNATGTVGDVASADGKTKGNVTFFGQSGNADGTVTGAAGTVLAYSGGASRTIQNTFVAAPPAGKTTITNESNTTYAPGSAKLATTAKSKVDEVLGFANGDVEIAVAGSVVNDVRASLLGNINSMNKTTVTLDGAGGLVEQVFASSTASVAGNSKISVAEGASVGGNVNATASGDASVENAGEVEGTLTANAGSGGANSFEQTEIFDGKGVRLSYVSKQIDAPVVGSATVVIAETGSTGGSVLATATKDASVDNGGSVGGSLTANAGTGNTRAIDQELVYDKTGALVLSNVYEESNTRSKGNASVVVAAGAEIDGGVVANATQDITINNAGTIGSGVTGNSSGSDSTYVRTELTPEAVIDAKAGTTTTKYSEVIETTNANATGKIDFTNAAGGVVGFNGVGTVDLNAGGDITILNQGEVRGITNARSSGGKSAGSTSYKSTSIVDGKGGSSFTEERASSNSYTATGGSVTGTYAGANGTTNFGSPTVGNVTQVADLASTVTVTGSIFGDVRSTAGNSNVAGTLSKNSSSETTVLDVDASGTRRGEYADSYEETAISGGDSKVVIAGRVAVSENAGGSANVISQGTNSSSVAVSGSVEQNVTSNSFGARASKSNNAGGFAQTFTKGAPVTDELSAKFGNSVVVTDGVASASITGKATANRDTVGGSVSVNGVKSATVDVASKAVVGGNLFVNAGNGADSESATEQTYVRDAKTGVATASEKIVSTSGAAAAQGNAAATIAGTVEGGTYVNAGRGNATVTLTGVSEDYVTAIADGNVTKTTVEREWTGKTKSASENFGTLVGSLTGRTLEESVTTEITRVGGKATVLVDTAQALKDKAAVATDDVYASGVSGASVEITKGSIVASDVEAESVAFNSVTTSTTSNDGKGTVNLASETKTTIVGGPASVTNAGLIGDDVFVTSATSATVTNTGKIGDNVSASAIVDGFNSSSETTNFGKASLQTATVVSTPVVALGKASVTNAAGATIGGDIEVEAGEGTVTNNGTVRGTTFLGRNIDTAIRTEVRTDTSTEESYAPAAALLAQAYTVNQNGVSGGFDVRGGLDNDLTGEGRVKTSDVKATINLNSGSATLGSIFGEVDEDGNRTTNTTVNLVGSGFLGADAILYPNQKWPVGDDKPNPVLSLGKDAQDLFGGSNYQVRVVGVETLNKEGAGTFVINGAAYEPALPGGKPSYTLDVGNFNIKAGEVQLTTSQATDAEFGVRGNINNAATLVLGRRITPGQNQFGNSLVGQTELIDGITVRQVGDYNQTAAGTTVVGLTPTLVRVYRTAVGNGDSLPEPLAPVAGNVSVGYFTTPALADAEVDPSRVNITGNLNLAGKVAVNVYRDSLYANGDGYTLFTYTGTGAVSAAAAPTLTSPFVGFTLVHDTAKKEVRLEVKRSSYAGGANNPNAVAAATGLDSALASAITKIRTDAAGGAGFASVTELGYAQDIANVATALDFRLSSDQAAQLFNELSSGEVYGSLAAVDQNGVFGQMLDVMTNRRSFGGDLATQLWLNPVGNWAKYGDGDAFGASDIRANSYGLAGGVDFAYAADGAFGFGGAYAEHDIAARGTPEAVDGRTWTVGAYVTQGFGPIYANAKLAYGWTNYDATRTMGLLARTAEASINAKQFDVSLEAGYDYRTGSVTITPYGKLVLRRTSLEGFTETGAGAFSLDVEGRKKTVFSPVLGVKLGTETELSDSVTLRPFARASYTFQGNLPSDITARYVGGGDAFILKGAEPDSFGMIEAGFEAKVADRLNLFFTSSQTFGGDNKVTGLRGGVTFQF